MAEMYLERPASSEETIAAESHAGDEEDIVHFGHDEVSPTESDEGARRNATSVFSGTKVTNLVDFTPPSSDEESEAYSSESSDGADASRRPRGGMMLHRMAPDRSTDGGLQRAGLQPAVRDVDWGDVPVSQAAASSAAREKRHDPASRRREKRAVNGAAQHAVLEQYAKVCSGCERQIDAEETVVSFSCGHNYHMKCYQLAVVRGRGSDCPACYSTRRFDVLLSSHNAESNLRGSMRALMTDNSIGAVNTSGYVGQEMSMRAWQDILRIGGPLDTIDDQMNVWTECNPDDSAEAYRRASLRTIAHLKGSERAGRFLKQRWPPKEILSAGVGVGDFMNAGASVDNFVGVGYGLRDLYDIGFRQWGQLLTIGANVTHLLRRGKKGEAAFPVFDLVDLYNHDYNTIITFIAQCVNNFSAPTTDDYAKACGHFCVMGFTRDDLSDMKFNDIKLLEIYGMDPRKPRACAITPEQFVALCSNLQMDAGELREFLKLDNKYLFEKLNIRPEHLQKLRWSDEDISREFDVSVSDHYSRENVRRRKIAGRRLRKVTSVKSREVDRVRSARRASRRRSAKSGGSVSGRNSDAGEESPAASSEAAARHKDDGRVRRRREKTRAGRSRPARKSGGSGRNSGADSSGSGQALGFSSGNEEEEFVAAPRSLTAERADSEKSGGRHSDDDGLRASTAGPGAGAPREREENNDYELL